MNKSQMVVASLIVASLQGVAAQSDQPRTVKSLPGRPIAAMLRLDDTLVKVERGDVISVSVDHRVLSLQAELDERALNSDAIAVVEPIATNSYLVEEGEWIRSRLKLRLVRLLKGRVPSLFDAEESATVRWRNSLEGVRVRAGGYLLFKGGERYLVSLKALSNGKIAFVGRQFRVTTDDRIAPIYLPDGTEGKTPNPLYGLSVNQLEEELLRRPKH